MDLYEAIKDENIDGKKLAGIASSQVNSFCRQDDILYQILGDDETEEEFQKMSIAYVKTLANCYPEHFYDGRNEAACKTAHDLVGTGELDRYFHITNSHGIVPYTDDIRKWESKHKEKADRAAAFAYYMAYQHRTLQQSFASLAFECIKLMLKDDGIDIGETMQELGHYDFTKLPLI